MRGLENEGHRGKFRSLYCSLIPETCFAQTCLECGSINLINRPKPSYVSTKIGFDSIHDYISYLGTFSPGSSKTVHFPKTCYSKPNLSARESRFNQGHKLLILEIQKSSRSSESFNPYTHTGIPLNIDMETDG